MRILGTFVGMQEANRYKMSHFFKHCDNLVKLFLRLGRLSQSYIGLVECSCCLVHRLIELFILIEQECEQTIIGAADGVIVPGGGSIVIPSDGRNSRAFFPIEVRYRKIQHFGQLLNGAGTDIIRIKPRVQILRQNPKSIGY